LIAQDAFAIAGPFTAAALQPAVEQVSGQLAGTEEVRIAEEGLGRWLESFRVIQAFEIWRSFGAWVTEHRPALGPGIRERIAWAATVTEETASAERSFRASVVERLDDLLGRDGVVILPTAPGPAPRRGLAPEALADHRRRAISLLCIAGLAGLPQLTLPHATLEGCPLGLSLIGPRGSDLMLLQLARRLA
jgi:amidase